MIPKSPPPVDGRDASAIFAEFGVKRYGYLPQWNPPDQSAGAAIGQILARFLEAILQRLNQAPARNKLALLDMLGIRLISAQAARAPIAFQLGAGSPDSSAPAGTQIAAPPPVGSSQQIVFETEMDIGITSGKLAQLVSLWPGRDEYIDHSAALAAAQPATFFDNLALQPIRHTLYLGHSTFLAIAGSSHLEVEFNLNLGASAPLEISWEYWDSKVWRGFKDFKPSCLAAADKGRDGTNGLMTSGSVRLDTDGAQSQLTAVNGISSFWIRGSLTQPLPPDPALLLPDVETIRLRTLIEQSLELTPTVKFVAADPAAGQRLSVYDENRQPLGNVTVQVSSTDDLSTGVQSATTSDTLGNADFGQTGIGGWTFVSGKTYQFAVSLGDLGTVSGSTQIQFSSTVPQFSIEIALKITRGLLPDKALCDGKTLDVSKTFFPLSQLPVPGTAFYFKQNEIFTKPNAHVQIFADGIPPQLPAGADFLGHLVNWEYWNGSEWTLLLPTLDPGASNNTPSRDFRSGELIEFVVPNDMVSTAVNNEDGLWIRARVVTGAYGIAQQVDIHNGTPPSVTFNVPQAPALMSFRMGYTWSQGPVALEEVLTYNDFQYEDHTDDARLPGKTFSPFTPIQEITPAVYFGFSQKLPVNNFGLFLDLAEEAGQTPLAMLWEYWNGGGWRELVVRDETQSLTLPGMLSFIPEDDSVALARFDTPLHWLRGRLKEDGPPDSSTVNSIALNCVWASQRRTFANLPLGASTGAPNQIFTFTQVPVLPGQIIEIQELSGPRANVEWRLLALELSGGDASTVQELEDMIADEGTQTSVVLNSLRLTRDRNKKITEAWVTWSEKENFFDSGAADRHYVLDHASGRLFFGDGLSGKIPPASAAISGSLFRSGGGLAGNLPEGAITQLLGSVPGIQGVANPRAAEGGADGETLEAFSTRAPQSIRHRGRAVMPGDYETMAHEASAGVAIARAIPIRNSNGMNLPGCLAVMIIPQSQDAQPMPSFGLRDEVRTYLAQRAPGDIAAAGQINVIGPSYFPVDVDATIAAKDLKKAGTVEQAARAALEEFLHPLRGGPGGQGWDLGRGVYLSDIATVLGGVTGVDYVERLSLSAAGKMQGDHVEVSSGQIVVAGQIKLDLI
ncbi:MAG TPA: putative baseplate assembly protein [Candidatus Saccharimonadales bacterium]|nr:putative baseplate assembly protein [Candidatus Saccharimonadales bacterium]